MNKQRERATIEAFLRSMHYPVSCLVRSDRERPDALVRIGDELIGVEVTTVSEAAPRQTIAPQKWSSEAVRIVRAAQESFEKQDAATLVVRLELCPAWNPPGRSDFRRVADEFAAIARRAITTPPPFIRPGEPIELRDPHPDVCWAYIDRTHPELGGHWAPSFAGQVLRVSAEDIKATVARKEPEIAAYRQVANTVWLLIDCDLSGQGICLDVPEPCFHINTSFDRVFCCGFGMWQWIELPVTKPAMGANMRTGILRQSPFQCPLTPCP